MKTRFLRDEGEIFPCSVCGRAARAARPTTHRRSAEPRATGEIEAIWRRLARRKRDGGELEASWRRDADGGETADADEVEARWQMEARDGGEMQMEARWRRDGGETGARWRRRRGWRRRVARAARLWLLTLTLTLTRVRSCGFSRRSHSEHPALEVSRRTCGSVRRHDWRVIRRPASSPTRLSALADGALRSPHEPSGAAALLSAAASTMLEARAEHRPGVRQLENVARAASQLSLELAPPARRPRAPARKQRGVAELCCAHLSDVQV